MSSILRRLRLGEAYRFPKTPELVWTEATSWLNNRSLVQVNIQECQDEVLGSKEALRSFFKNVQSLPVVPGRSALWMEYSRDHFSETGESRTVRYAVQVLTDEFPNSDRLRYSRVFLWVGLLKPTLIGASSFFTENDGTGCKTIETSVDMFCSGSSYDESSFEVLVLPAFLALLKMNCSNVQISPEPKQRRHRGHRKEALCSVWRTLQISDKIISRGLGDSEESEVRLHWVRGHFRRIPGHLKPIWIKWHQRGNPELGEVVHSYDVQASKIAGGNFPNHP